MRFLVFPRLGCFGWLLTGWLLVIVYALVYAVVLGLIVALYLIAGTGVAIDWSLRAIPRYRQRRAELPVSWPVAVRTKAIELTTAMGRPKRGVVNVRVVDDITPRSSAPPAGWLKDPGDPTDLRWWDGTKWTEHVQPKL